MKDDNSVGNSKKRKKIILLNTEDIAMMKWGELQAQRLRDLRGDMTRVALQERTTELGLKVTHQYIQQLENPSLFTTRLKSGVLTVSVEIINSLALALEVDTTYFYSSAIVYFE